MSRDYAAEMRAVIDAETMGSGYAAPVVAARIVKMLRTDDPELLAGYLDADAVNIIRHAINLRDCAVRTHNRTAVSRSVFRQALVEYEGGSPEALMTRFLDEVYRIEDGSKMRLGDMGRVERRFVADDYDRRAGQNAMHAAFVRAIDKKCGPNKRTSEVFDEEKLAELWESIAQ